MFSVGLTGGIASGKTTVSDLFAARQVPVIDTDLISRELLEPGERAYQQVVAHFGEALLDDSGRIDLDELGYLAFAHSVLRAPSRSRTLERMRRAIR